MHRRTALLRKTLGVTLPAMGAIAILTLAGCSNGGKTSSATPEEGPLSKYLSAIYDGEAFTQEKIDANNKKVEELVAKCMTKEGFEYEPNTQNSVVVMGTGDEEGPQWGSAEFAKQYGYGLVNSPGMEDVPTDDAGSAVDPNQKYVDSLSESEQQAYYETLNGPQPTEEEMQAMQDGDLQPEMEIQGCYGEAQKQVQQDPASLAYEDPEFTDLFASVNEFWSGFYGDGVSESPNEDIAQLDRKWSECMADAGHPDLISAGAAQNMMYQEYSALQMPNGENAEPVEPSKADQKKFQKREIEVATADAECKATLKYNDKLQKIQFEFEQKFVDDNQKQLDALVAKYGTKKKEK